MQSVAIEAWVYPIRIRCPWRQNIYIPDDLTVFMLKGLFSPRFFSSKKEWSEIQTQIVDTILSNDSFNSLPVATHLYRPRLKRYYVKYERAKYSRRRKKIFKVKKNYPDMEVHESRRLNPPRYCELFVMLEIHVEPVQCVRPVFYDFMDGLCHRRRRRRRLQNLLLTSSPPSRRQLKRLAKRQKRFEQEALQEQRFLLNLGRRPDILGGTLPSRGQSMKTSPS